MRINNEIGNYPGFKYYTIKFENSGDLQGYSFKIKLKDEYYKRFIGNEVEIGYTGPLSGRRSLQDDGVKLCTCDISNSEVRIASTARFASSQPPHDIGVVIKIPVQIESNPQDYIEVVASYKGLTPITTVSDKPNVRENYIQSGTRIILPNEYFG